MDEEYKTRTQRRYKGRMPFKLDLLLYSLFRMIFSLLFFFLIYVLFLGYVRSNPSYSLTTEIIYIFIVMIVSDILAMIVASQLDRMLIHRWEYIRNDRHKSNIIFRGVNYFLYVTIRTLFLVFNFTFTITNLLMENYGFIYISAFFLAWILCSLMARLLAWVLTNILFPT